MTETTCAKRSGPAEDPAAAEHRPAGEYVVTFAHRSLDTRGLRRMSLASARSLVSQAAQWNYRHGRVLLVTDTHEGIEIEADDE